jgi:hypothetical protein
MKRSLSVALFSVVVLSFFPAHAIPTLTLSDGTNSITVQDGLAGDISPVAGVVTFYGAVGGWWLNVSTGVTKPAEGSALDPYLHLNSVNALSQGVGTLTITFSENGFSASDVAFVSNIGGVLGNGSISFATYLDGALLSGIGPIAGPGAFSGSAVSDAKSDLPSSYTLTELVTLTHNSAGLSSFDAQVTPVPEPSTLLLLGSGLAALGAGTWRRSRKK